MSKFRYIPENQRSNITNISNQNKASNFASALIKTEFDRYGNSSLMNDYQKVINNGCIYLPNFFCKTDDYNIVDKLKKEIQSQNPVNWSKHSKYENPEFSPTFNEIVYTIAKHFNIKVIQTRLNYYRDGNDWKPFHHDSHAYGNKQENFTVGASFGASRELVFLHEESGNKFSFPQNNGDIFAFNKEINQKFMHGVPKDKFKSGERFSIIVWGKKM